MYQFDPTTTVLAGLGTVFLVLAIIIIVISLSKHVFAPRKARTGEREAQAPTIAPAPNANQALVAVIAAAVAAASGASPASFRIASIEPNSAGGFNTPVWGHINRISGEQR